MAFYRFAHIDPQFVECVGFRNNFCPDSPRYVSPFSGFLDDKQKFSQLRCHIA